MKPNEIKKVLDKGKHVIFGGGELKINKKDNYEGLPYLFFDKKRKEIRFTTDNQDYIMSGKLEEVLEKLFKKFEISEYKISIHKHSGEVHDKDIIINMCDKDNSSIAEIIKFIQDNFYKLKYWDFDYIK